MTPFPMIYTLAQQHNDEVRRAAHQEPRLPAFTPSRWWHWAPAGRKVTTCLAPASLPSQCAGEQPA